MARSSVMLPQRFFPRSESDRGVNCNGVERRVLLVASDIERKDGLTRVLCQFVSVRVKRGERLTAISFVNPDL